MKRNIYWLLTVFLAFSFGFLVSHMFCSHSKSAMERKESPKLDTKNWAEAVKLPGAFAMPVSKLLYTSEKPTQNNFFGDGFSAYVVRVKDEDMTWFVQTLTGNNWDWWQGKFVAGHMDAYVWVMGWMEDADKAKLAEVVDVDALIKKPTIIHRQEVQKTSSGNISNVSMWIIDPDENIIVFLNEDT